VCEKEKELL